MIFNLHPTGLSSRSHIFRACSHINIRVFSSPCLVIKMSGKDQNPFFRHSVEAKFKENERTRRQRELEIEREKSPFVLPNYVNPWEAIDHALQSSELVRSFAINHSSEFATIQTFHSMNDITPLYRVGSGTFGQVWFGYHSSLNEVVAVKQVSKAELVLSKQAFRICIEIRLLKQLSHEFLVKLYGVSSDSDYIYIILKAYHGKTLYNMIKNPSEYNLPLSIYNGLPLDLIKLYTACIVEILYHLHDHGVAYRDLKADNLLIQMKEFTDSTETDRVDFHGYLALCDFGLSRSFLEDHMDHSPTLSEIEAMQDPVLRNLAKIQDHSSCCISFGFHSLDETALHFSRLACIDPTRSLLDRFTNIDLSPSMSSTSLSSSQSSTPKSSNRTSVKLLLDPTTPTSPSFPRLSRRYSFLGSVSHMAPEVSNKDGHDSSSDIWSLGVLLYEMIFRTLPFGTDEDNSILVSKRASLGKFELHASIIANEPELVSFLHACLTPNIHDRPSIFQLRDHEYLKDIDWSMLKSGKLTIPVFENATYPPEEEKKRMYSWTLEELMNKQVKQNCPSKFGDETYLWKHQPEEGEAEDATDSELTKFDDDFVAEITPKYDASDPCMHIFNEFSPH
jgi:serine/threonine protein kinase